MTITSAAGLRILALILLAGAAGAALAGCGSIDNALFAGGAEQAALPPTTTAPTAPEGAAATPATTPANPSPGAAPESTPPGIPAPVTSQTTPPAVSGLVHITIEPGTDTGTAVGHAVAGLRAQLETLASKLGTDAQRLADVKTSSAQATASYLDMTANIHARLALGTTRGNPELINQWNTAQGALDTLTGNINALSRLADDIKTDSSAARSAYDAIQAAYNLSGGVDEDQRQLNALSDEASQTGIVTGRLMKDATLAIQRQTAYVANERGNLTALAGAIRNGDYTGPMTGMPATNVASAAPALPAGSPIVTIRFDRTHVAYEKTLYSALSQALATQPKASFSVIGVAPAGDATSATHVAASSAERDAQAVMRTMGEMGVPSERMALSSSTDPEIAASEVRVYLR